MATIIKITPPNGTQETIKAYQSCSVSMSITERAGSFSLTLPFKYNDDISRFVVGSDVEITQNGHVFRGWVIKPPQVRNGALKTITLSGADYTAKTQKIVVTESYEGIAVDNVVNDLFTKYVPWATRNNISVNNKLLTIRFPDLFLWDAMEQICELTGFQWYIDSDLDLHFFEVADNLNSNIISEYTYKRGSASFEPDSSKLVNKLWVKGSKAVSLPYSQPITVGTEPIPLYYTPRAGDTGIQVVIGGVSKTLGIQNIHKPGIYDFLLNYSEKLLIPDLCTSGTGTITYSYEYPIKLYLENEVSQTEYGIFEDILNVETTDKQLAREIGLRYLEKYSVPVLTGSIEPLSGIYKCGELIKIELPNMEIDEYLVIKSVSYESTPMLGTVNIKLTLENTQRDLPTILKDFAKRLRKIENTLYGDEEATIEKYKVVTDSVVYPKLYDETVNFVLHDYLMAEANIMPGIFRI